MTQQLTWRRSKDGLRWESPPYFVRRTAHGFFAYFNPWNSGILPATREKVAMVKTLEEARRACAEDYVKRLEETDGHPLGSN